MHSTASVLTRPFEEKNTVKISVPAGKKWRHTLMFEDNASEVTSCVVREAACRRHWSQMQQTNPCLLLFICCCCYCCSLSARNRRNVVDGIRNRSNDSCVITSLICDISLSRVWHLSCWADLSQQLKPRVCLHAVHTSISSLVRSLTHRPDRLTARHAYSRFHRSLASILAFVSENQR